MKLPFRLLSAYGLALLMAVCFGVIALLVGQSRIGAFDSRIISVVQGWESPGLTRIMEFFSWIGSTLPATVVSIVIAAFLFFALRHRKELILFIAVAAGAPLLNKVLKSAFHRERPDMHRIVEEVGYAFPSGHAMASFAIYGVLGYLLWRHITSRAGRTVLIVACSLMFLLIGISRIYLGVHYPSDVVAGYMASGMWLGLAVWAFQRWTGNRARDCTLQR